MIDIKTIGVCAALYALGIDYTEHADELILSLTDDEWETFTDMFDDIDEAMVDHKAASIEQVANVQAKRNGEPAVFHAFMSSDDRARKLEKFRQLSK